MLDSLARYLMQWETVEGDNLDRIFRGQPPIQGTPAEAHQPTPAPNEPAARDRPTVQPVPRLSPGTASSTS